MGRGFLSLILAASISVLSACRQTVVDSGNSTDGSNGGTKPIVVVSIPPLVYFVEKIGGDKVETGCLAPASADPETFEPSMAQLRKASEAGLLINLGLLPFERKTTGAITASHPGIHVVELHDSIDLIEGTHDHGGLNGHDHDGHGHDDGNYDPHIWTSLRNARIMARNTCHALSARFPADSLYFKARLDSLDRHLDSLDRHISGKLAPVKGKAILVWHPSLSYFARDYGLRQLAIGNEHKESSITGLKERLDLARREKPLVFFHQKEYDSRQAKAITDATGLQPVVLAPLSPDIEGTIRKAADALVSKPAVPAKQSQK